MKSPRLGALRRELAADLEAVAGLRAVEAEREAIDALVEDLDRQLEGHRSSAVITIVGPTGAGKSTLLNALAGREVAREGVDRPTTREPAVYAPSDADLSEFEAAVGELQVHRYEPRTEGEAAGATAASAPILIDAPDWNSVASAHREVVAALAEGSDVLIALFHRQAISEAASLEFLDAFSRRRRILFALGRADELDEASREALRHQLADRIAERWGDSGSPVLVISVKQRSGDFPALLEAIDAQVRDGAIAGVRRHNALGAIDRLADSMRRIRDDIHPNLEAAPAEIREGAESFATRSAAALRERFALRRPDVEAHLWEQFARRWDGPGGLALRARSWTTLGLGAGALLARRSPLLAAGAAVAGAAAEGAGRMATEHRMASPAGLGPALDEVDDWAEAALLAPAVRAERLLLPPARLPLPTADVLQEAVAASAETAWGELVDRDLPASAEQTWLRHLRLLLDLPVYAMGAWLVFVVARGFWAGDYVGLDVLTSVLILTVAYLLPIGFAVRRVLSWRAARLLDGATGSLRGRLLRRTERELRPSLDALDLRERALARLCGADARWRARAASP